MIRNFLFNYLTSNKDIAVVLQLAARSPFVELATAQLHYICLRGKGQSD